MVLQSEYNIVLSRAGKIQNHLWRPRYRTKHSDEIITFAIDDGIYKFILFYDGYLNFHQATTNDREQRGGYVRNKETRELFNRLNQFHQKPDQPKVDFNIALSLAAETYAALSAEAQVETHKLGRAVLINQILEDYFAGRLIPATVSVDNSTSRNWVRS